MWTLLSPRFIVGIIVAGILATSHFTAYRSGKASVRSEWDAAALAQANATLKLVQEAREKEKLLADQVTKGAKRYEDAKKTTAVVTGVVAERVRHFQGELDKRDAQDAQSPTSDHGRTPERLVLGYCAASFYQVGGLAEEYRQQIIALQDYIKSIQSIDTCK